MHFICQGNCYPRVFIFRYFTYSLLSFPTFSVFAKIIYYFIGYYMFTIWCNNENSIHSDIISCNNVYYGKLWFHFIKLFTFVIALSLNLQLSLKPNYVVTYNKYKFYYRMLRVFTLYSISLEVVDIWNELISLLHYFIINIIHYQRWFFYNIYPQFYEVLTLTVRNINIWIFFVEIFWKTVIYK